MVYRATTKGLIEGIISGYNATIFAYGPTGKNIGSVLLEDVYFIFQWVGNNHVVPQYYFKIEPPSWLTAG